MGADGTPSTFIDLVAEEKVTAVLKTLKKPVFLISEEIGEVKIGEGPAEAILVVDPLDGTSNAIKNIPAYGISIAVADISSNSPNAPTLRDVTMGMVKNFATGDFYYGFKGRGAFLNGQKIHSSQRKDISSSLVGAYVYRGDMNRLEPLCKAVRRMRTLGSVAIEICYVADGTYDAFVDIREKLRIVDVSAAKIIVEESGGTVTDQNCHPLDAKLSVIEKTALVASGNKEIHQDIMGILGGI
ncbi:MAG: Fructose-1,6-bisphosphatase/inositol-1-monophosphatase [candidate division WS2 bacterium]|nr:Fructose-1,6-bisphosphatase/inositol-1-monophosphatase [Candidatus Psychracetigena formicireducens]